MELEKQTSCLTIPSIYFPRMLTIWLFWNPLQQMIDLPKYFFFGQIIDEA